MTLAYQGKKAEELPQTGSMEARREHLFNAYIERMFRRKGINQQYPKDRATHWLTWLAQRMFQASQSAFLIEQMQPTWLQTEVQKLHRFGSFLIGAVLIVLILWPIYAWDPLQQYGLWKDFIKANHQLAVQGTLVNALCWGLVVGTIAAWGKAEIETFETLTWPWKKTWKDLLDGLISGLKQGLIFALSLGLISGLWSGLNWQKQYDYSNGLHAGLIYGITYGLKCGLSLSLSLGLISALRGSKIEEKTIPNQGIWKSAMYTWITGLISWLMLVIGYCLIAPLINNTIGRGVSTETNWIDVITPGLRWGLMLGLIFGGGLACIRHSTLRLILHRNNYIPWNYARFLDYATEQIFLQKVGGGYIFVHRMLLEHFARMK